MALILTDSMNNYLIDFIYEKLLVFKRVKKHFHTCIHSMFPSFEIFVSAMTIGWKALKESFAVELTAWKNYI